ncbi:52 kDa repressor of the inhibitor of the protein kinase-like [Hydra vulgaris]|uniref:52 kDa repressor of the inhibitor of the protein kinase-like n=1 Tax=Hydra vulgaris TaxID=6087 RepID=A0ABM4BV68_HYDVU
MKEMEVYQALKTNNHSLIDQIKLCNTAKLNNFCQRDFEGNYILHKFSGAANGFIDAAASNSLARLYADKLIDKKTYSMVPVRQNMPLRGHRDDAKHLVEQCNNAVDKASDVSQTEQMAVIVRYVDEFCNVKEDFLKNFSCNTGLSGVSLSTKIKKSIHKLGLEMSYCHGQGYDGAGNMALILKDFPIASYVHCFSHQLNLCVAKACAIPSNRDMMDYVRIVADFLNNSSKRLEDLSTKISELCPTSSFQKTINVCRTRWIERIDSLEAFIELYPAIVASLICIKEDVTWNYKSRGDASAYVSFIDISHTEWYKEAVSMAATTNAMPSKPRTCGQQTQPDNHEVDDISEYYQIICSIPFLDHILIQLDSLFSSENLVLLNSFSIIPSYLISDKDWRKKVKKFVCTYQNDLPEPRYFYAELDMWEVYWKNHSDSAPKTISDSPQKCDDHTFPNISTIL